MDNLKIFKELTNKFFTSYPQIKYEWGTQDNGNIWGARIFKRQDNGFDVWWGYDGYTIYYTAGRVHHSELWFDKKASVETQIMNHVGFLRDLLSNKMRLIEKYAGKTPCKALIQSWDGNEWRTEDILGILFFNYLGKRSEVILQNDIVEGHQIE